MQHLSISHKRRAGRAFGFLFIGLSLIAIMISIILPNNSSAADDISVKAAADTYVRKDDPNRNFGSASSIVVDASPLTISFLRFQVSGAAQNNVAQARLRLNVLDNSSLAGLRIFSIPPNWEETKVTWNTQPALGSEIAALAPRSMPVGAWIEVDLSAVVTGDGIYNFAVTTDSTDRIKFSSRSRAEAAQLVLTLRSSVGTSTAVPSPTSTPAPKPSPTAIPIPTATASPAPPVKGPILAFPGAEGFGAATPGGRGGRVIEVTNLNDAGRGSLRAALESSEPRIVVFKIGGTIQLTDNVIISNPYITIAGQTAPGEGIQIKGGSIVITTHDVILRHIRGRPGDLLGAPQSTATDGITLKGLSGKEVYNVVIDHCSFVWGPDTGGVGIYGNVHDVTMQYSINGEGLFLSQHAEAILPNGHSKGIVITDLQGEYGPGHPTRITLHHNLITTSDERNPSLQGVENMDVVNNVIYNWGSNAGMGNPISLNLIKNVFIKGPETTKLTAWNPAAKSGFPLNSSSVYEQGTLTEGFSKVRGSPSDVYSTARFSPYSITTEQSPEDAYAKVSTEVGATLPVRDSIDQRIIKNLVNRTGNFMNGVAALTPNISWPSLASAPPAPDSDHDGLPDSWEAAKGLSPNTDDSAQDSDGNGYTNIEEYINGLTAR